MRRRQDLVRAASKKVLAGSISCNRLTRKNNPRKFTAKIQGLFHKFRRSDFCMIARGNFRRHVASFPMRSSDMEETRRDIEIRLKKREAGICAGRAQFAEKDDRWTILHGPRISPHLKMKPLAGPSAGDSAGLNIPDLLKQAVDSIREFAIQNFSRVNPPRRGALSPLSDAQSAPSSRLAAAPEAAFPETRQRPTHFS
jgi:hypothetical protein